ncbi:MAG: restriction endonuclease subunit S [Opitutales bacterium]|nr:restriction endonuclease subunit S [Opitutales bacterium]
MNDGLKEAQRSAIIGVLAKCPKLKRAILFGSRAMGTFTHTSDIDIALEGDLSLTDQANLAEEIEQLSIPYKVDLVRVKEVSSRELQEHIKKQGKLWYANEGGTKNEYELTRKEKNLGGAGGKQFLSDLADFNPSRPIKRGSVASFVDMASLPVGERDITSIQHKEFGGSGSRFRNGDTLLARITPCLENGKTTKVCGLEKGENAFGSTEFIVLSPKDSKTDEDYIYYLARHPDFRSFAISRMEGTSGRQRVSWQAISEFEFDFPDPEIRVQAGQILRTLDDKIALNRKLNETLEEMSRALFHSWFVDFDPVKAKLAAVRQGRNPEKACMAALSGKLRISAGKPKPETLYDQLPTADELDEAIGLLDTLTKAQRENLAQTASNFPADFQESELGLIPEEWEVRLVESLIDRIPAGKKYAQKTAKESGKIPILDQGKSGIIGFHDNEPGVTASPEDPIIVFANHTCYMRLIMHDFSTIQNVLPFKGKDRNIFWLYCATYGQQEFVEYKGHWPDLMIKLLATPPSSLCDLFGKIVRNSFVNIFELDKQSSALTEIRDTLLPKLLSGVISVGKINASAEGAEVR